MAKHSPTPAAAKAIADAKNAAAGKTTPAPTKTEAPKEDAADIAKKAADKLADAQAKADARAAKQAEKDKIAADKKAVAEVRKQKAAENKAAREARLAELGKNYHGSMLALADAVKQGKYVKGATGQLRSNDELAQALDGVGPTDVVKIGLDLLKLEDNPYTKLNIGQQSMNLRNRLRGAINKGTLSIMDVKNYIARNSVHVTSMVELEAARAEKAKKKAEREQAAADKKAKAEADKAAKAQAKEEPKAA